MPHHNQALAGLRDMRDLGMKRQDYSVARADRDASAQTTNFRGTQFGVKVSRQRNPGQFGLRDDARWSLRRPEGAGWWFSSVSGERREIDPLRVNTCRLRSLGRPRLSLSFHSHGLAGLVEDH